MGKTETTENPLGSLAAFHPLRHGEFEQIRRVAHEKFGLDLRSGKEELVSARLGKKLRQLGFETFQQYLDHVEADLSGEALTGMIDALTTNHTMFLREPAHFEFLRRAVATEFQSRNPLEIWSAACATGEEPYSIAISLLEELGERAASRIRVTATDISTRALESARKAVYPAERFNDFPPGWLPRYFLRGDRGWMGWFRVKNEVRQLVDFRRINLIQPLEKLPLFSVIFCRNVMIYFDRATQQDLVRRMTECLEPGGYLLLGHAESLLGDRGSLEYVRPAVYRKPQEGFPCLRGARSGQCAQ